MGNCSTKSHNKWLIKAKNDLEAAKLLYKADYLDVAIYHTQQCAEKALKGFLAFCNQPLIKSHDLVALVTMSQQFDSSFLTLISLAEKLTPFSVLFRYPEVDLYPEKKVVLSAIHDAEKIFDFVSKRIK